MIKYTRKHSTKARKKKKGKLQLAQADLQRRHILELPDMDYKVTILAVFIKTKTSLKLLRGT